MKKIYTLLFAVAFFAPGYCQSVLISANPGNIISSNVVFGTQAYNATENIFRTEELGANTFTVNSIRQMSFYIYQVGSPTTFNNVKIYLKNISATTDVLATGTYSTTGYTLVFSGSVDISATGETTIDLSTPFLRTAGSNLELLIERADGVAHPSFIYYPSIYDATGTGTSAENVARRYNGATALSAATSLAVSVYRPAIKFIAPFATDAIIYDFNDPDPTCFGTPQTIGVVLKNKGYNSIAAGAAAVTLNVKGSSLFAGTINNSAIIAPGASETINFSGIDLSNPGTYYDSAFVVLAGDGDNANDTAVSFGSSTATVIASFPALEDAETTLPVFSFAKTVAGTRQLWSVHSADTAYTNTFMVDSLHAHSGTNFYYFDAFSGTSTDGFVSRLYSNCIKLTRSVNEGSNFMTFWMSHDTTFLSDGLDDSLYVSVSTDKGLSWTRVGVGYGRLDPTFGVPGWSQHTADLSAFGCQTIQIAFEGSSKYGNIIGVDDIQINSTGDLNCTTPVTLLAFTAQKITKANKLVWKTSQEINSSKFLIEQSSNGRTFSEIGQVQAAGNSNTERTYSFTHNLPSNGYNYYRIKMVDLDGRFKYSPVRNLQNLGINEISSYPNPVRDNMRVNINAEKNGMANVIIADFSGKAIYSKMVSIAEGENNFNISTTGFTAGNYVIKIQMSENVVVKKFIKL